MRVIDSNIPFKRETIGDRYPIEKMAVGESFLVCKAELATIQSWDKTCSQIHMYANRRGMKISTKKGPDGVRVWRIA